MPLPIKDLFGEPNGHKFGVNIDVAHRALEIGKAAEHLVCADLLLQGHMAFLAEQGMPYDVIADCNDRLYRIQVKSTLKPRPIPQRQRNRPSGYLFHIRRAGKGHGRIIGDNEFDILALVALDIRTVAYLPLTKGIRQSIHLRTPGNPAAKYGGYIRKTIDQYPFLEAINASPN